MRLDLELEPAWNTYDLTRTGLQIAKLSNEADPPILRHEQHLAVGVVEVPLAHALVKGIDVHRHPRLGEQIAVPRDRRNPINKVGRLSWNGKWVPAKLVRGGRDLVE